MSSEAYRHNEKSTKRQTFVRVTPLDIEKTGILTQNDLFLNLTKCFFVLKPMQTKTQCCLVIVMKLRHISGVQERTMSTFILALGGSFHDLALE